MANIVAAEVVTAAKLNLFERVYDRVVTTVDVASTATETDLYSKSIAANDMQTDRMLRLTLVGDLLRNNGEDPVIRVKFGGTTLLDDTLGIGANSATRYPLWIEVLLAELNGTASQFCTMRILIPGSPSGATTGVGDLAGLSTTKGGVLASNGTHSVSTTTAQTFSVTADWAAASASSSIRRRAAYLEMLPA